MTMSFSDMVWWLSD
uniref:Uncharacterized protein n=1 Tax=Pseudomonas putida TaxID=303 RepID=A0A0N9MV95_PSEPU|nr:hypothetical protein [Pseudomonas putida]